MEIVKKRIRDLIPYAKNEKKHDKRQIDNGGSGTTIMAAEQNGRRGYLMELDPKYCDVIIRRRETLTGEKAVLANE